MGIYLWGTDATVVNGKGMEEACDLATWSLHVVESEVSIDRELLQGNLKQLLLWTPVSQVMGCRVEGSQGDTLAMKNIGEIQNRLEIKDHDVPFPNY